MKKNCNGCRAICGSGVRAYCSLGHSIGWVEKYVLGMGVYYTHIPKEECPKPKTYSDLIFYNKLKSTPPKNDP